LRNKNARKARSKAVVRVEGNRKKKKENIVEIL
jgi:hypothetical protein